jgi:hypothetical protein
MSANMGKVMVEVVCCQGSICETLLLLGFSIFMAALTIGQEPTQLQKSQLVLALDMNTLLAMICCFMIVFVDGVLEHKKDPNRGDYFVWGVRLSSGVPWNCVSGVPWNCVSGRTNAMERLKQTRVISLLAWLL